MNQLDMLRARIRQIRKEKEARGETGTPQALYYLDHSSTHKELLKKFYSCNRKGEPLRDRLTQHPKLSLIPSHRDVVYFNNFVLRVMKGNEGNKHQVRLYYVSYEVTLTTWIATGYIEAPFFNQETVFRKLKLAIMQKAFKMTNQTENIRCWN